MVIPQPSSWCFSYLQLTLNHGKAVAGGVPLLRLISLKGLVMSDQTVSPYLPNSNFQQERLLITYKTFERIWLNPNDPLTPDQLAKKLKDIEKKAKKAKWFNITIGHCIEEGDDNNLPSYYLVVRGSHHETDDEYEKRQKWIMSQWKSERDNFELMQKFYESPRGLARIQAMNAKPVKKPKTATSKKR